MLLFSSFATLVFGRAAGGRRTGGWMGKDFSPNRFICRGSGGFGRGPVDSGHFREQTDAPFML